MLSGVAIGARARSVSGFDLGHCGRFGADWVWVGGWAGCWGVPSYLFDMLMYFLIQGLCNFISTHHCNVYSFAVSQSSSSQKFVFREFTLFVYTKHDNKGSPSSITVATARAPL